MNDCYSRLRRLVPTIPPNKKVSKVEILQHVIDYILDLQLALETHPALPQLHPAGACPAAPPRTPLTALNTDPVRSLRGRPPGITRAVVGQQDTGGPPPPREWQRLPGSPPGAACWAG
ncbi:DNA-binding protein inhibitor ID-4 [Lemmus lemmus]